jgi:hypothetical protein
LTTNHAMQTHACDCHHHHSLSPELLSPAWLAKHERCVLEALAAAGWSAGTSSSSSSSSSKAGGAGATPQRSKGRTCTSGSGGGFGSSSSSSSSKPVRQQLVLDGATAAAVKAGLRPSVARQLLALHGAAGYELRNAALRQLCTQLAAL